MPHGFLPLAEYIPDLVYISAEQGDGQCVLLKRVFICIFLPKKNQIIAYLNSFYLLPRHQHTLSSSLTQQPSPNLIPSHRPDLPETSIPFYLIQRSLNRIRNRSVYLPYYQRVIILLPRSLSLPTLSTAKALNSNLDRKTNLRKDLTSLLTNYMMYYNANSPLSQGWCAYNVGSSGACGCHH